MACPQAVLRHGARDVARAVRKDAGRARWARPTPLDTEPVPARRTATLARAWEARPTGRELCAFGLQVEAVAGVDLADEAVRGLLVPQNPALAQANAMRVMDFERAHDLWLEPWLQRGLEQTHHLAGLSIGWGQVVTAVNAVYGLGHLFITLTFALWLYWFRRDLFPFVRNLFLLTNLLAVVLYNLFPLAPPRLATGLRYLGRPFHFADTVFGGGGGVKLSFDEFAAMPSLHVAWALIVGLTVVYVARAPLARLLGLLYPLVMGTAVVVSGNHYIADGLGAMAVLSVSFLIILSLSKRSGKGGRAGAQSSEASAAAGPRSHAA